MNLTGDALKHLSAVTNSTGLSHNVFIRTQYDVLRRLRAYWLLRYLVHKEHIDELRYFIILISHLLRCVII